MNGQWWAENFSVIKFSQIIMWLFEEDFIEISLICNLIFAVEMACVKDLVHFYIDLW